MLKRVLFYSFCCRDDDCTGMPKLMFSPRRKDKDKAKHSSSRGRFSTYMSASLSIASTFAVF